MKRETLYEIPENPFSFFVEEVIDYEYLDCLTSVGGFLAAVIDLDIDGDLMYNKIYWGK